jgi:hypothetical protein
LFCAIQRRKARGEALKFTGAFLAAAAWITFVLLAKGTTDFQGSDIHIPGIITAIAIAIALLGFQRERRATRELDGATARLAMELDKRPTSRFEAEQSP